LANIALSRRSVAHGREYQGGALFNFVQFWNELLGRVTMRRNVRAQTEFRGDYETKETQEQWK
jgi:hypothetical protein